MRHGEIYWNELNSWDPESARAFYERVLGWRFEEMRLPDGATYWIARLRDNPESEPLAGLFTLRRPDHDGAPEHWLTYFSVEDVDAAVAAARDAGGEALRPPFDVPGVGRIAMLRDAGGAVSAVMTPER